MCSHIAVGLTPQKLIMGEVEANCSFWSEIKDDPQIGPSEAVDVLACWAHLRRFEPLSLDQALVDRINSLVQADKDLLCWLAVSYYGDDYKYSKSPADHIGEWRTDVDELEECWDYTTDADEIYELEMFIQRAFVALDRASLVRYAVKNLRPGYAGGQSLQLFFQQVEDAERHMITYPYRLSSAATYASSMLHAYRHDLHECDEALAETTRKHRVLRELLDERDNPPRPARLDKEVVRLLIGEVNK